MSGRGCRTFEAESGCSMLDLIKSVVGLQQLGKAHIARCDVAFDDVSGVLPLDIIYKKVSERWTHEKIAGDKLYEYVSPLRSYNAQITNKGITVYIGSETSDLLIRFYDKACEQKLDIPHWVRLEMQLRNDHAYNYCNFLLLTYNHKNNQVRTVILLPLMNLKNIGLYYSD